MIIPKLAYIKYLIITNCEPNIAERILKEIEEVLNESSTNKNK